MITNYPSTSGQLIPEEFSCLIFRLYHLPQSFLGLLLLEEMIQSHQFLGIHWQVTGEEGMMTVCQLHPFF